MSGIEIAGLVLGALPILIEGVRWHKKNLKKGIRLLRWRHVVEKLNVALLTQQRMLTEIIRSVLERSGCKGGQYLEQDPVGILGDTELQEHVADYLGEANDAVFQSTLLKCQKIVCQVAEKLAGLVPTTKEVQFE